ncbi:MAG: nucleotidyltransferase family protein [Candidatus Dormibacteraceae bacterium]
MATDLTLPAIRGKRREISQILAAKEATNPRVFGSVARGTGDSRSDLDLLIDLKSPAPQGFAYFGLLDELQQALSKLIGRSVHVIEFPASSLSTSEIAKETVPL